MTLYRGFAVLAAIVGCAVVHELGHFLAAALCGERIAFRFGWGRIGPIPVPRFLWNMPDVGVKKARFIAQSGFLAELAWGILCAALFRAGIGVVLAAFAHMALYPWYAGAASDFKWMVDGY